MQRIVKTRIPSNLQEAQLLSFLTRRFTYHDQSAWRSLIADQRLTINSTIAHENSRLAPGDILEYQPDFNRHPEPEVNKNLHTLYEDDSILVVNKPANLPCHPAGPYFNNTLWALVKPRIDPANNGNLHLVHRLDRETSGIVVIAKSQTAASDLQRQFQEQTIQKTYLVIVEGATPERFVAQGILCQDPYSRVRKKRRFIPVADMAAPPTKGEQSCKTIFRRIGTVNHALSILLAQPKSGGLHQIRATLHSLGHPVVGDKIYGVDDELFLRFLDQRLSDDDHHRLRLNRQALHHLRLTLRHPKTHEQIRLKTPIPPDIKTITHPATSHF